MRKKRESSIEEQIDYLEFAVEALTFEVARCCYYLQQIKCVMRNGGLL